VATEEAIEMTEVEEEMMTEDLEGIVNMMIESQ